MSTPLNEDDLILLEALIRSPAFMLIKKITRMYREEAISSLTSSVDTPTIYRNQGRLISLNAVDNLPLLVQEWQNRKTVADVRQKEDEKRKERLRPKPLPDRKLPPKRV